MLTLNSRIAPTPSGFLHRGNAFNFLLTQQLVRATGGTLLLRIDDMDRGRYRQAYVEHIFKTLNALAINIDRGPQTVEDFEGQWSQQLRLPLYVSLLDRLVATGRVYACDCSRKRVRATAVNGVYDGHCRERQLPLDAKDVNWRIRLEGKENEVTLPTLPGLLATSCLAIRENRQALDLKSTLGDFVIRKKDGMPAYQVCSLADDLHFGIDLIVRGEDLLASSAAQVALAQLLGESTWLEQLKMIHHPLLRGNDQEKLSKSAGAKAIETEGRIDFTRQQLLQDIKEWAQGTGHPQLKKWLD